jgi:hypothetical protein
MLRSRSRVIFGSSHVAVTARGYATEPVATGRWLEPPFRHPDRGQ